MAFSPSATSTLSRRVARLHRRRQRDQLRGSSTSPATASAARTATRSRTPSPTPPSPPRRHVALGPRRRRRLRLAHAHGLPRLRQFGLIGATGMLFCWCATMVVVPASITARRAPPRARAPRGARRRAPRAPPSRRLAGLHRALPGAGARRGGCRSSRWPARRSPRYLRDPWEYNFAKLERRSKLAPQRRRHRGSTAAPHPHRVVGRGRAPADLLLADRMEDALPLAEAVVARDRAQSGGRFVHHVDTVWDVLGGSPPVVARKLELLGEIRAHLDAVTPQPRRRRPRRGPRVAPAGGPRAPPPDELPTLVRERFTERDGRFGTPVFVVYQAHCSPSDGRKLLECRGSPSGCASPTGARCRRRAGRRCSRR